MNLLTNHFDNRKQRVVISGATSSWKSIESGVPQGSIWGPFIINIYANDIFYFAEDENLTNFADNNTLYAISDDLNELIHTLESNGDILLKHELGPFLFLVI